MSNRAWVTLATNDSYGLGALVLAHSLRRVSSAYPAVVLITPSVTEAMKDRLRAIFAEVVIVDVLDSRDAAHLALLQRPELGITFTKIHCWNLTQYEKCVFLDADTLVVQNCDELFEREELSAAPDVGWPDCFNSGVFVYSPSADTFSKLVTFASERGSFDGGDQGLLNSYFSDWAHGDINKHLPFLYNVTSAAFYSYIPALKHYGQNLKIIHFIGAIKPWLQQYNWVSRSVEAPEHLRGFLQLWWDLFVAQVHAQLDTSMIQYQLPQWDQMQYGFLDFMVHDRKYSVIPFIKSSETIPSHCKPSSHRHNMCSKHTPQDSTIEEEEVEAIIEEQSTVVPQEEVLDYNQPVLNYGLYEPLLDEESEFPWHQPGNQLVDEEINVPQIDMSQFNDPWEIYRGNIPPSTEDSNQLDKTCDYEDVRKHAWDYTPSHHNQYQTEINTNYEPPRTDHQHTHHSHTTHHHHHERLQKYSSESSQNIHHSEHNFPQYHYDHNKDFQEHNVQYQKQHETQHFYHQNDEQQSKQQKPFYPHEHHETYYNQSNHNNQIIDQNFESHTNNHILHSLENFHEQTKSYNKVDSFTYSQIKNKNIAEQVYTVMMDHVRVRSQMSVENLNGYASDNDSDIYEDIRPRHPYDGFYLRHRMTIDSRGRKICIHEVPYIPCTPSSVSSEEYEDALETVPDDNDKDINDDVQTGVAGNLARIVPGAALEREAIDELARRQGWEAGNIDYMGADSFDNIWAKISQTLSQPPTSVEQPPPPEEQPLPTEQQPTQTETKCEQPSEPIKPAVTEIEKESSEAAVEKVVVDEPSQTPAVVEAPAAAVAEAAPSQSEPEISTPAVEPESVPVPAEVAADVVAKESVPVEEKSEAIQEIPVTAVEALKIEESPKAVESIAPEPDTAEPKSAPVVPESATVEIETAVAATEPAPSITNAAPVVPEAAPVPQVTETKPETTSDSPPLANTPSKEEIPKAPAAKSEERRKPAGKLQLPAPVVDALPTPDSELEDAATLAHAIIASELRTPTVTSPSPPAPPATSPPASDDDSRLSVKGPEVPTPPVSLSQIGVKPKPSTAAQIESSLTKTEPKSVETETPKKKVVKKAKSKESASSEAPVPPPRKKEKKPKEK